MYLYFITSKMLFHCFLATFVSTETLAVILIIIVPSIYDVAFFS